MRDIYLIEPSSEKDGHFYVYKKTLLSIEHTVLCPLTIDFSSLRRHNAFMQLCLITISFFKLMLQVKKGEIVHVLYADIYYKIPFIANKLIKNRKTVFTVHSCPKGRVKRFLMRHFYKNAILVIVHSEFIKRQLEEMGLNNVKLVHYPSFFNYSAVDSKSVLKIKKKISNDSIVLGALGGLRFDKGIDILIDSMRYVSEGVRKRIVLNIAGAPFDFTEDDIKERCRCVGVKANLTLRFLTDQEFMENIVLSDIMVFPYRSTMTANSGPMTEAMVNHIPCIIPARTNLASINDLYDVGVTFEQENAESLGITIEGLIKNPRNYRFEIAEELKVETFLKRHKELYDNIIKYF